MRKAELRTKLRKATNKTCHCLRTAAWQACKVTCWIACAPCLCCCLLFVRPRHRRSHARDPFNPIYPDLPAPRRRALSLPLLHPQPEQGTVDQTQSLFMTKLPLEVRRLVYEHVLGGKAVHVMNVDGRLCARRCLKEVHGGCECGYFDPLEEGELEFGVGILGSCRQIYSESVEFLYSSNAFSISTDRDDLPTLDYLSYWILPQRIQQIRNLRIHWEMDSIPYYHLLTASPEPVLDQWINSWETLGQFKGLRHLHVNLVFRYTHWSEYYDEIWKIHGAGLLQSIKKVTAPLDFVVVLPNRNCAVDVDLGDSRCVLKLPEGEGSVSGPDD